jgi:hypothetical protein
MKSISALAIVSIIAILLAIGLVYIVVKPPSFLKTTTTSIMTSYIPTTEIITETTFIPTTYIITTTYVYTTTYTTLSTYPTTITKTITQTITFTYVPTEKIEIPWAEFKHSVWSSGEVDLVLFCIIINKNYSEIYIDPNRNITIRGKGILNEHPKDQAWYIGNIRQKEPFTFSGYPSASLDFTTNCNFYMDIVPDEYNPKEIKHGQVYTVSFDYKVIYINGTWSDWKTFTFNLTYTGKDMG